MRLASNDSMRKWTVLIGVGVAIFCFGLCLLIFGRAYRYDSSHHDLFLAFGCVFMIPGGILVLLGCFQLFRVYMGYLETMSNNRQAPPPGNNFQPGDDVFGDTSPRFAGKGDYIDHGQMRPSYAPHDTIKSAI